MSATSEEKFRVSGLHCASCARSVEKGVGSLAGVDSCELDFTSGRLRVSGSVPAEEVRDRIRKLGFDATPEASSGPAGENGSAPHSGGQAGKGGPSTHVRDGSQGLLRYLAQRREVWPALVGGILLLPGLIFHEILRWEALWIEIPALAALVLAGTPVVRAAWRGVAVNRELNIQALMTIAVVGAVVIGAWVEAGMVVVLFALGEALEGYATSRARGAIRSLMTVAPESALRIERTGPSESERAPEGDEDRPPSSFTASGRAPGGGGEIVLVEELEPGDVILVRPGERIPMDGRVRAGRSAVDQAALTGESLPLEVEPDSEVLAGSVNGEGALEVEVTNHASETVLHRMIRLVEEAQSRRAPVQRFIDRFARLYTPAVVALAVFIAVVPPLAWGAPFWNPDAETFGWFYRALALLVIACPCALVISVPASMVSALTTAARHGVLIKGGAYMEALSRIRVMAFDKTGTLTEGALTVVGVRSVDCSGAAAIAGDEAAAAEPCEPCDELLALAAAVEQASEHPVGRAVVLAARDRLPEHRIPIATDHRALAGRGITANLSGESVTVGSHRYFELKAEDGTIHHHRAEEDAREGRTPVVVEKDGRFLGTITLTDVPRPTALAAVRELEEMGVATVLLSGDSHGAATHLADRVGIREARGELLPEEKVRVVRDLRARLGPLAMVGDGINDAPALATADVGIAVGGDLGGTDQARDAAAVTLMWEDLRMLPRILRLAREAMRTVKVNVAFAIGIKALFLLLVLAGMGTLWMAVLADVGATLLVTLYGIRLLRWDPGRLGVPETRSLDRGDPIPTAVPEPRPAGVV
jgi:Zn2+/Cd2+-exporting ATPase